ncbi:Zinc finger X-linked protein ZXDB [Chelonia mydas]|uniref:Zinc finger X-linked protein ZXDB n=1 Tax=Chelonia mydas TaxID=8469 RepID=M7BCB7_CHEMY|nr:Zinc finger X-linked protein ZXDB [Chelonia mydas]
MEEIMEPRMGENYGLNPGVLTQAILPVDVSTDTGCGSVNATRAKKLLHNLNKGSKLALQNALRYFPPEVHKELALEFAEELKLYGHIYMYRFCPEIEMRAYPIEEYPCKTKSAAAIMHMIMNNLDPSVAQFPQELVTYGGNGQVFSSWAQFWLVMHYLSEMTEEQTLVMYSGHPLGLFPSHRYAPRLIITNGMVIPNYSSRDEYEKMFAMGVTILVYELDTTGEQLVDLGSDQTSCHNPFSGGYYPVQLSFEEANQLMSTNPGRFRTLVQESLRRQVAAINRLSDKGMVFWDYGNAFLLEAQRAGADVEKRGANKTEFRYPSYVQHIMGRHTTASMEPTQLTAAVVSIANTSRIILQHVQNLQKQARRRQQRDHDSDEDMDTDFSQSTGPGNLDIMVVVGSQARILYSDRKGRVSIAVAINRAIAEKRIKAPVVLSRDHHDVSGTDSPYRETSDIYDGSAFCADMAVQNFVGDAVRGATWVALHNGGGVGWCEACGQRFPSAARLGAHQRRSHLEPDRPYRCEFPGCERTFITVSALFSHNRAHFREQEQFSCSFPGCSKQYDKACRLKIHMRSHTGERPFICDSEGCGWSFTSMSKLLRHKRKHEDDRRFTCPIEGCGKSFTRAEHLKGHSITHLGTKPFECPVEGCCAKFSARSSLYIHSKKHLQDVDSSKTRCPVSSCNKLFTSKHSMKTHMVKQHNFSPDLLTQLEATSSLTPSSELTSPGQSDLSNIDLVSLFSNVSGNNSGIATDMALVNSGIVTIDVASVGSTLGGNLSVSSNSLGQTVDPLILVTSSDIPHSLDSSLLMGTTATVLQQSTSNLDDVQTVNAEALGSLASLSVKNSSQDLHGLTSSNNLTIDTTTLTPSSSLGGSNGPELLTPTKAERNLLPSSDVVGQQEGSKVVTQFVFSNPPGSYSAQKEMDLSTVTCSSFLDDPPGEGDLPFQLSSQSSSSHSQLTVDLPVHILQEPHNSTEDDAGSDNSQFTGSTINLQDLE